MTQMDSLNQSHVSEALDKLQELLRCSNCSDYMNSPIYRCKNDHTICSKCKQCWPSCISCSVKLGDPIRCPVLEKMAESLVVNCRNKKYGCPHIMPYTTMHTHQDSCNFLPYTCPLEETGCMFPAGPDVPTLVSHLTEYHKAERIKCTFYSQFVVRQSYGYNGTQTQVTIINCLGTYFCLHSETFLKASTPIFMAFITLIGDQADCLKYRYRLQISKYGAKSIFEGMPRSIKDCQKFKWAAPDSLLVQVSAVQSEGKTTEANLEVRGDIWKHSEGNKYFSC